MRYLLAIGIVFMFLVGCKKKSRIILRSERHLIDSAYLKMIDSAKIHIDSVCAVIQKEEYESILDSIIEERILEIQQLKEK